eukprot:4402105-Pyramimonas_sp.AAC.1
MDHNEGEGGSGKKSIKRAEGAVGVVGLYFVGRVVPTPRRLASLELCCQTQPGCVCVDRSLSLRVN